MWYQDYDCSHQFFFPSIYYINHTRQTRKTLYRVSWPFKSLGYKRIEITNLKSCKRYFEFYFNLLISKYFSDHNNAEWLFSPTILLLSGVFFSYATFCPATEECRGDDNKVWVIFGLPDKRSSAKHRRTMTRCGWHWQCLLQVPHPRIRALLAMYHKLL